MLSCLDDFIINNKHRRHTRLEVFADNTFGQNKNRYVWGYFQHIALKGVFEEVVLFYPLPGHSIMPIDRDFGAVERRRKRYQCVHLPDTYVEIISTARQTNPFEICFVNHPLRSTLTCLQGDRIVFAKDFNTALGENLRVNVPVMKARSVKFTRAEMPQKRESMTGDFSSFNLCKTGHSLRTISLQHSPRDFVAIKEKKVEDVKSLLQYIKPCYRQCKFFESVVAQEGLGSDIDEFE